MFQPVGDAHKVPIVEGTPIAEAKPFNTNQYNTSKPWDAYSNNSYSNYNGSKGETQPTRYNDIIFAIAFILHIFFMAILLVLNTASGNEYNGNGSYSGIIGIIFTCGLISVGLSTAALTFMMNYATELVKMALFFSIACNALIGILGIMTGQIMMFCIGLVCFALSCCYAYFVWSRIPFATANLKTSLVAVKQNMGLFLSAAWFILVAFLWTIGWAILSRNYMSSYGSGIIFLLLLSFFWTHQVLTNTLHVISSGVIGTWWFVPEETSTSLFSPALTSSFQRACTYSFGSICFGSLLVAIVQALKQLLHMIRDDENILNCLIDCILDCLESIIEYFNKWAYVYVGLYGYSYIEAGKNVMTLFQNKGWTTIITDDLAENVLFMINVGISVISGFVSFVMVHFDNNLIGVLNVSNPGLIGFLLGMIVGFVFSSILLSVVGSAINTVIVCFAESPGEFEQNHCELSSEMRNAWRSAWPNEF